MIFGDPRAFAIECHHDPLPNETRRVFGRMHLWVEGLVLGQIDEPACMLDVTVHSLERALRNLELAPELEVDGLGDEEAFAFLDDKIYSGRGRSIQEVAEDSRRFGRFDFLTNGGESFDRTKSFILRSGNELRILFLDHTDQFRAGRVDYGEFKEHVGAFFQWVESERERAA